MDIHDIVNILRTSAPNSQGVSNAIYAMHSMSVKSIKDSSIVEVMAEKLASCHDIFDGQAISNSLYGLKNFDESYPGVGNMLSAIEKQIQRSIQSMSTENSLSMLLMSPQGIGCAFIGLQNMNPNSTTVRKLLRSLAMIISESSKMSPLDGQAVANILASLKHYSSELEEVRQVLRSLKYSFQKYPGSLQGMKSKEVSMSLWGLQSMSLHVIEVTHVLEELVHEMSRSGCAFRHAQPEEVLYAIGGLRQMSNRQVLVGKLLKILRDATVNALEEPGLVRSTGLSEVALCSALYGLQSMDDSVEVRELIAAISRILNQFNIPLQDRALANALFGLQGMSSESKQIRFLLKSLHKQFNPDIVDCSTVHIGMMLYGMRSMCNNCLPVKTMLHTIFQLLSSTHQPMSRHSISSAFYGLQSMEDSATVRKICVILANKLQEPEASSAPLSGQEVGMILHGLRGIGSENPAVCSVLDVMALKISQCPSMSWSEVCMAVNGLQSMGGGKSLFAMESEELSTNMPYELAKALSNGNGASGARKKSLLPSSLGNLFGALVEQMEATQLNMEMHTSSCGKYSTSSVASAVYGLQGLSADNSNIKRMLTCLTTALKESYSYDMLDGQDIGRILFGLQNVTARSYQVRKLLHVLADGIAASNCSINAQVVGNSLYGMQGFSSDVPEVRKVLVALSEKISSMPNASSVRNVDECTFTGQNIGNALWGLRNMSTDVCEVRQILSVLTPRILQSSAEMSGQNIGNAFYALHRMSDVYDEVKDILKALAFKLMKSTAELSGLDIGMALFGLQNMNASTPEVQVILGILLHKIKTSQSKLQLSDLSLAIVGLLSSSNWIKDDFMKVLATKTDGMDIKVVDQNTALAVETYGKEY